MPRIDEMPEHRARLPHSTHDLSHTFGFTATSAHLLPIFHTMIDAGDSIDLNVSFNLRTQPLSSAAMEQIDCHVEYFFVPMFLLYEPFGSIYYQIEDNYSSLYDNSLIPTGGVFPVWDWQNNVRIKLLNNETAFPYTQNGVVSGDCLGVMAYRLLDMLGFNAPNNLFDVNISPAQAWNPNIFPYQLLAYHCIYQKYYRLDAREKYQPKTFNWDSKYQSSVVTLTDQEIIDLFTLHYRPKASDYFTDVKVSPMVDVLNLLNKNSLDVTNQWLTRSTIPTGRDTITSGSVGLEGNTTNQNSAPFSLRVPANDIQTQFGMRVNNQFGAALQGLGVNGFDIGTANIRAMFANEKLWNVTGRAKKNYDDQTLAHFGYKVPHDPKHEISSFGHDHTVIDIGEVISTAQTTGADLGSIAGKGYAHLTGKSHRFKAPCHGVVMAIFSVCPRLRYGETFCKHNAVTSRFDLPIPEYDHLGLQPLFFYEGYLGDASRRTETMGWQYRYEQWKRRYNRVSRAFVQGNPLASWMVTAFPWVSFQGDLANTSSYVDYLYKPDMLNQLFLVQYTGAWSAAYETVPASIYDFDPFVVNMSIGAKLSSWMSDYSLPRLDA